MITTLAPSRLRSVDIVRAALEGLRSRKLRALLSALGVAIGIASLVGVTGLAESSKSDLLDQISALGTNLLTIQAGTGFGFGNATLPEGAVEMVRRIRTVESVSAIVPLDVPVYRNDLIPKTQTRGLSVVASDETLLATLSAELASGSFLSGASLDYPAAVLGFEAAKRLGVSDVSTGVLVRLGERWVEVIGILEPVVGFPALDRSVIIGLEAAADFFDSDGIASVIHVRVAADWVSRTRDLLPSTVEPEFPEEVEVTRPSDSLAAKAAADETFSGLLLGLGAVALLVGGIGIANVMVVGVMERRGEIGLRRALGATRAHIRLQFLAESVFLALVGGVAGIAIGSAVTAGYSTLSGWRVIIPGIALGGGLLAAVIIGAGAGIYPAIRAARLSPSEALRAE